MYTPFTNRNIQQLYIVRDGWIKPEYVLTDNIYSYGKLVVKWVSAQRKAIAEAAGTSWHFRFENFWKTSVIITNQHNEVIGRATTKVFRQRYNFVMNNGFTATFRKTSFWKPKYLWEDNQHAPILRIEGRALSSITNVFIEQSNTPAELISMLTLLGLHLIIIRRQREAAVASS